MPENILDVLEKTAGTYGSETAVCDPSSALSWHELVCHAKGIGTALCKDGCDNICLPVAVFADKSCAMLAAMFGAVYAGGFYVPINPEQPSARIASILTVLEPAAVIVQKSLVETLNSTGWKGRTLLLEDVFQETADEDLLNKNRGQINRNSPLYGLFTSGSTGVPKCVLISHGDVLDFIGHFVEIFHFSHDDVIGNQAPFDFDVSTKDIYSSMATGARMVLIPREYFSTPARLIDYLIDRKVTSLTWAVSALCIISGLKGFSYKVPSAIHRVMFSGEVMPARQLAIWQKYLPDALYVNLYGPSEITCNCTYEVIDHVVQKGEKLSLGKVFPGRKVVLLDKDGRQVDGIGAEGEIAVSGESLALGYYHNPEQTRTHFVMRDGVRTYLTGDLAAIGEDGKLYFAGRRDFQIKHMGHRIELEEVERGIDSMDGVERSCCAYNQERSLIIAYYTGTCDKRDLHIALKSRLPVYMVPNRFVHVKSFILNKNGKIDRKQLANLEVVQ
ncbi:MAG: AMP-binding protein [Lactimicrobium massiliense]|nr:AMP-binding protein [Lactimicrobium massiliense]MDD6674916.1 AMP-binding protein [Lactimicrobium massiliense]